LLQFEGLTSKSDTIHTNIQMNRPNWCKGRNSPNIFLPSVIPR